jgi:hypothetical protein
MRNMFVMKPKPAEPEIHAASDDAPDDLDMIPPIMAVVLGYLLDLSDDDNEELSDQDGRGDADDEAEVAEQENWMPHSAGKGNSRLPAVSAPKATKA